jgi:NitT/TauT family transport system substrate-binding protein
MRIRPRRVLAATAALVLLATGVAWQSPAARAATEITVGTTGRTSDDWAMYVAEDTGIFAANGLDVTIIDAASPVGATQELIGGSIQFGSVTSTQMIEAVQSGAGIVSLWQNINKPPYYMIGKKGMTSVAQLKGGKTLIVSGPSAITRVFADAMLAGHGVKQDDVVFTYAGATNARFAALLSGGVDAAILLPPFSFRAISLGYPILDDVQKYYKNFPFDTYAASTSWLPTHHSETVAFLKSIAAGVRFLYDPKNKAKALQILSTETSTSDEDTLKTYDLLINQLHAIPTDGTSSIADYQPVIDAVLKLGIVKPPLPPATKFYDNSFGKEALSELNKK